MLFQWEICYTDKEMNCKYTKQSTIKNIPM
jgi:hypothetical protein